MNGRRPNRFTPTVGITPTTEVIRVTPDMARKWLSLNTSNNRPVAPSTVAVYARDMKLGRWRLTHQGIAFNNTGELIDGQHRLMAVVQAEVAVDMTVARGFDLEYDSPIDQGRGRSMASILHRSSRWVTMMRCLHFMSAGALNNMGSRLSLAEISDAQLAHEQHALPVYEAVGVRIQGGILAALAWCLPLSPDAVLSFGLQVKTGEMLERGDPAYALRTWLGNHQRATSADHIYVACSAVRAAIEGARLASVAPGPTAYRWSCGRRRALRVSATPGPEIVHSVG